jgi:hypothetical protein
MLPFIMLCFHYVHQVKEKYITLYSNTTWSGEHTFNLSSRALSLSFALSISALSFSTHDVRSLSRSMSLDIKPARQTHQLLQRGHWQLLNLAFESHCYRCQDLQLVYLCNPKKA